MLNVFGQERHEAGNDGDFEAVCERDNHEHSIEQKVFYRLGQYLKFFGLNLESNKKCHFKLSSYILARFNK